MSSEHQAIADIMRQTECYDTDLIKTKYEEHRGNVIAAIFDILKLSETRPTALQSPATELERIREIMQSKDTIFAEVEARTRSST